MVFMGMADIPGTKNHPPISTAQLLIELHGFGGVFTKGIDVSRLTKRMAKLDQVAVIDHD